MSAGRGRKGRREEAEMATESHRECTQLGQRLSSPPLIASLRQREDSGRMKTWFISQIKRSSLSKSIKGYPSSYLFEKCPLCYDDDKMI